MLKPKRNNLEVISYNDKLLIKGLSTAHRVNGLQLNKSHNNSWMILNDTEIKKIEIKTVRTYSNYRYELIDESLANDKIPKVIDQKDESKIDFDFDDCEFIFKEDCRHLTSLYTLKYDVSEESYQEVFFDIEYVASVPKDYKENKFKFCNSSSSIKTDLVDSILYPAVLNPELKCSVSSNLMYSITRAFIKQYINPKFAIITSDYDFCFKVEKKINLFALEEYVVDVNNNLGLGRKRKEKLETRYRSTRNSTVFEMTHDSNKWKEYTPIQGMSGENYDDLQNNIQMFLDVILLKINEPMVECPHCEGRGVIIESKA